MDLHWENSLLHYKGKAPVKESVLTIDWAKTKRILEQTHTAAFPPHSINDPMMASAGDEEEEEEASHFVSLND